jgi:hypothetical protein
MTVLKRNENIGAAIIFYLILDIVVQLVGKVEGH